MPEASTHQDPTGRHTNGARDRERDPSPNVLDLVRAEARRTDDLRKAAAKLTKVQLVHGEKMAALRSKYDEKLRTSESARIDAIRAVDVAAVQRASEVASEAVQALATQVPITAEAVRVSLAATVTPILADIAELRRAQYEQQGQKAASSDPVLLAIEELKLSVARGTGADAQRQETRAVGQDSRAVWALAVSVFGLLFFAASIFIAVHK